MGIALPYSRKILFYKPILCKDLYLSTENNRVQSANSSLILKELENIIINLVFTTVYFRRNLDISTLSTKFCAHNKI